MLVFAASDKGGTGRTVTSSNIVYRRALQGGDVCYLDFDFGSPTAGAVFQIASVTRGTVQGGLHAYLHGDLAEPHVVDVWTESERDALRSQPPGAGRLMLYPGDSGGGEFVTGPETVRRCVDLFLRLEEEYDLCLIDLSAGRSYAVDVVLAATAQPELAAIASRWLVFHRWTRQHIYAAADLLFGQRGIIDAGVARGHDREQLTRSIRLVRTAVVDPNADDLAGLRAAQVAWLRDCNYSLQRLARENRIGRTMVLGTVPLDPMLQWREQLVSDDDVVLTQVANSATVEAFDSLAQRLTDDSAWEGL
ncbi:SCO2523 family variant P-loop protein [Planosporangium mesophilum]|uniref:DNA-binding protein n=1 Tax=Planosporangium mesophilum TaxID=689768 RepID=A0A8J3X254_9ACTN|nr:SCO2523 family variant P-loop protein [Planosporangium mesophilum]NJC86411.1 MinD/ParA family protein [Planosporangium mesophilum]GII25115.1 DNA-binding protein [Planosporangium mesophilum]